MASHAYPYDFWRTLYVFSTHCMPVGSLIKDLLRAWKVLGRCYLKSGNSLDETH